MASCSTGVPFDQDGLRDGEHLRDEMTGWFRGVLSRAAVPWMEVAGPRAVRVDRVIARLMQLATAMPVLEAGA